MSFVKLATSLQSLSNLPNKNFPEFASKRAHAWADTRGAGKSRSILESLISLAVRPETLVFKGS